MPAGVRLNVYFLKGALDVLTTAARSLSDNRFVQKVGLRKNADDNEISVIRLFTQRSFTLQLGFSQV